MSTSVPHNTTSPQSRPPEQSVAAPTRSVQAQPPPEPEKPKPVYELKIYSHSSLVYWWPVWAVGYLMAILTYSLGQQYQIGQDREWFHASSNLGVFFFLTLFLVISSPTSRCGVWPPAW